MFTLLSGLYSYLTQRQEYFVLILGLDNAGKTVGQVSQPWLWLWMPHGGFNPKPLSSIN